MPRVAILGATGSIGRQALEVMERDRERFTVCALTANRNVELLAQQADRWRPGLLSIGSTELAQDLRARLAYEPDAILHGAVKRIRPKFMTVATEFLGLVPILWATGTGSDVMKRIAAPIVGGVFTSFLLELLVYPAIYEVWRWHFDRQKKTRAEQWTEAIELTSV